MEDRTRKISAIFGDHIPEVKNTILRNINTNLKLQRIVDDTEATDQLKRTRLIFWYNDHKQPATKEFKRKKMLARVAFVFGLGFLPVYTDPLVIYSASSTAVIAAQKDDTKVALKFTNNKLKHRSVNEARILEYLGNFLYVIKLLCVKDFPEQRLHCLELPYYDCASPLTSEFEIGFYLFQLLKALDFCHSHRVVHRDVKPSNILYRGCGLNLQVVLADFGLAEIYGVDQPCRAGTLHYMAPELFGVWDDTYTYLIDIWSAGVSCVEMICKRKLFNGETDEDIEDEIRDWKGEQVNSLGLPISTQFTEVLAKMLVPERTRLSAAALLQLPFFQQYVSYVHNRDQ